MSRRESQIDYVNRDRLSANPLYVPPLFPLFDGATFDEKLDGERLSGQLSKIYECMVDRKWRTLVEIRAAIQGGSEAGVSARLRDLRKQRWGGHTVERRRCGDGKRGVFEYQLIVNKAKEDQ